MTITHCVPLLSLVLALAACVGEPLALDWDDCIVVEADTVAVGDTLVVLGLQSGDCLVIDARRPQP